MHAAHVLWSATDAQTELGERGHPIVAGFEPGEDRRRCYARGRYRRAELLVPPSGEPTQAGITSGIALSALIGPNGEVKLGVTF